MTINPNVSRLESLLNKIWLTRKARIKAAERLERFDFLAQILVNYYTLFIVALSIWTLYDSTNAQLISVITIIASVLLFGLSIFVTSRNFKGRSLTFKDCYIKLDELYTEGELLKSSQSLTIQNTLDLQKEYNKILNGIENHTTLDFLNVLNDIKNISNGNYIYLIWRKIIFGCLILLTIVFPLVLTYLVTKA